MRVALAGGTGMIGTALADVLRARGDDVVVLTRRAPRRADEIHWDPRRGANLLRPLDGVDAVVNLCGEPLAPRPWTQARRRLLVASRVEATEALTASLERLERPPPVVVGVGALFRFGDRGHGVVDDDAPPGHGFLPELAVTWEDAQLAAASRLGARAAVLRLAVVLSSTGGVVPALVGPFRAHLGGWLGTGEQLTPWTSLRDAVRALVHLLDTPACHGGFNGGVPEPVTNRAWCVALGQALGRPIASHAPAWALRGAFGELADAVMLSSLGARPRKLLETGFEFADTDIERVFTEIVGDLGRGR